MVQGPLLLVILAAAIAFIVLMTARVKMHAFLVLLLSAFGVGILSGMDSLKVIKTVTDGFGGILSYIGIVIIAGTIIGTLLEKSRGTLTMANTVLKIVGKTKSALAMSITGAIVSIPVFCDSGFVILSSLNKSLAKKTKVSMATMAVALSAGLYATHTLIPPTPGPIAAAGTLGADLGYVILFGLIVAIPTIGAGYLWATKFASNYYIEADIEVEEAGDEGDLPSTFDAFAPIMVPIILITLKSIADFPTHPFGTGGVKTFFDFFGDPTVALILGIFLGFRLLPNLSEEYINGWVGEGLKNAASIIMITGAGGAFGAILKATPIGDYLGTTLSGYHLGIFLPFIIAAALKTAQGSSTVALITTASLVSPILAQLGLDSELAKALVVLATGAGAMTISHANDSYFWVVSQFSDLDTSTAYKTHSMGTLVQGITAIVTVFVLSLIFI
ncbi:MULTISPECIES: GntP family permease [unclassified Candidatus Frackibacter]|uniref:GntP family permease n=1 Tax=unclassified Candidatus Frackibacter TaxID=2648818 RepID=UPI000792CE9F|nr:MULTISPECIES: GntP family permease [unclassified Candidatus Frackibacter]KXS41161.1 MAG: gluconate transporter [Candidatus Frackibacter sp. T328-2]SDC68042.1 predicted D-glycerate permease [Candidatus Frackibacter sp. WG11]SEM83599.1 predicted D-glycerate permease [Candidatus Frackibacter sp. WG12]SFL91655.1 predicted D-glycerate permease [Candidatus Frackibacter sp. WG13]